MGRSCSPKPARPRWGEVWIPTQVEAGWRPYKVGHWNYTNEWGWFWISDEDWGWVTYHYGRWVLDADLGWIWIPRKEWGPAWVRWRHGHGHIGWAPLPPDEVIVDVEEHDEPTYWVFVRETDFLAPRIDRVVMRETEVRTVFSETVEVNRTVVVEDRGFAVNPGIEPAYAAAAIGRPIRPVEVRPPVIAGTVNLPGAIEVRPSAGLSRELTRPQVREASTEITPSSRVPPPTPLRPGERGKLGERPPAAARGETQPLGPQQTRPGMAGRPETPRLGDTKQQGGRSQQGNFPERTQPGRTGTPEGRGRAETGRPPRREARTPNLGREERGARGQLRGNEQGATGERRQLPNATRPQQQGALPDRGESRAPRAEVPQREQRGATGQRGTSQTPTGQQQERQRERQGALPERNSQERNQGGQRGPQQEGLARQPGTGERGRAQQALPQNQQHRGGPREERGRQQGAGPERGQLREQAATPRERRAPEPGAGSAQRGHEPAPRAEVPRERSMEPSGRPGGAAPRHAPGTGGHRGEGGGPALPGR